MKNIYLLILIAAMAAMFTGCLKDMPVSNSGKDSNEVSDLKVPASFNWQTTSDEVVCNVVSEKTARLSVATSATEEPFAEFFAGGKVAPVALSIPKTVDMLYMRYETADGKMSGPQAVKVASNAVAFAVGSGSRPFDDSDMELVSDQNKIYVPARANGWGTIFFEDMWPGNGDYDFNDLVFNYKVCLNLSAGNMVRSMVLDVRVKAVSGSFPYELYLQMHGVKYDQIAGGGTELLSARNTSKAAMTLLPPPDPNKNRALFRFDGIKSNPNKPAGAIWVNAEPGYELSDDQLVEATYVVTFTEPIALADVEFTGFDFFIGQMNDGVLGPEIHRCNYEPINEAYYFKFADPSVRDYYKTKDNLIWAINLPVDFQHTYDKKAFLDAYPDFKMWAQSGGAMAKDWYTRGVEEYLVKKR